MSEKKMSVIKPLIMKKNPFNPIIISKKIMIKVGNFYGIF